MNKLRVPLAIDSYGKLCSPKEAEKTKTYYCPVCKEPVILKKGEKKVPHFAHKITETCNPKTIMHKTAKILIKQMIEEWKLGKTQSPIVERKCHVCGDIVTQLLPDKVYSVALEHKMVDGTIPDIVLMDNEKTPLAAIEIRVTHAVDEEKSKKISIPFIELEGKDVIENPTVWVPVTDKFKPVICRNCKLAYLKFQNKAQQLAKVMGIELPKSYFRYGITTCWKCKKEILVFIWPNKEPFSVSTPKSRPIPHTLQFRYSKTVGHKYWANTCPYCKSIQGDFFLQIDPDGPFFSLEIQEDSSIVFKGDLIYIAAYAAQIGII